MPTKSPHTQRPSDTGSRQQMPGGGPGPQVSRPAQGPPNKPGQYEDPRSAGDTGDIDAPPTEAGRMTPPDGPQPATPGGFSGQTQGDPVERQVDQGDGDDDDDNRGNRLDQQIPTALPRKRH